MSLLPEFAQDLDMESASADDVHMELRARIPSWATAEEVPWHVVSYICSVCFA